MSLIITIDKEIKTAMLAKDAVRLRGLRAIKSALLLAKTESADIEISEEVELKILQKLAKQRKESADIYTTQNRPDLALVENEELAVIEVFLPKALSEEEIEVVVKKVIEETGANGAKDMGKIMGVVTKQLLGKADGKVVSAVVKKMLSN